MARGPSGAASSAYPSKRAPEEEAGLMTLSREEYLEIILDHHDHPHNHHGLPEAQVHGSGGNPGCGDLITMYAQVDAEGRITEAAYEGEGCTISQAAASMLTDIVTGKTLEEVQALDYE